MSYADRVKAVKAIFVQQGISEDRFWALVAQADWPNRDYNEVTLEFLTTLTAEEGKSFRVALDYLWSQLNIFIGDRNPAGGSDDSHSDFIFHIIGLGKDEFYANLKDYDKMEQRGRKGKFEESFGYCVPYVNDWDAKDERIAQLTKQIHRTAERKAGVKHLYIHNIIGDIADVLSNSDGDYVAEIYNQICDKQIEYVEDSVWKVKETA